MVEFPVPSPQMVRAARAHLARRYATGVEALMWEEHDQPLPDIDALTRVITAAHTTTNNHTTTGPAGKGGPPAAIDLGAALVVLLAIRLDIDRLEVELLQTARDSGMQWTTIADILGLPEPTTAEHRYEKLRPRLDAPVDHVRPSPPLTVRRPRRTAPPNASCAPDQA
jgi:hypothetical protein